MNITYIYHSCFVVELEDIICIFDYYKGELPKFCKNKHIFFFASHKHQDHFSLEILKYAKEYQNITFILSNDIKLGGNYLHRNGIDISVKEKIVSIGKNKSMTIEVEDDLLEIETLRSTDAGVAFVIKYRDKTIYHAGDLNWWSWNGETKNEYETMKSQYVNEVNRLEGRHFDVAFVVLDPRQEERYWWGFDYFMRTTKTDIVFPMHCWEKYSVIESLINNDKSEPYRNRVMPITKSGESFIVE